MNFGHSDTCWMPGQSSPNRRPKNALKLSTFVPYQDRGSQEQVGNGSPRLSEECNTKMANLRLLPTYSAFSNSSHDGRIFSFSGGRISNSPKLLHCLM
uniref:Uncharacterized protein n=1 Tax=Naja naja TaxID=35670 RepID=A0A8C6VPP3_NAJNA